MSSGSENGAGREAEPWEERVRQALGSLPEVDPPPHYFERLVGHQRPRFAGHLIIGGALAAIVTALGVSVSSTRSAEVAGLLEIPFDASAESGEELLLVLGAEVDGQIIDGPGTDLADLVPHHIGGRARRDFGVEAGVLVVWYGAVKVEIAGRTRHPESVFGREVRPDPTATGDEAWIFDRGANRFTLWGPEAEVEGVAAELGRHIDDAGSMGERVEATVAESLELFGFPV
ncbi:MAG: hypothetical protein GY929_09845 [Actinomycetia bacterium]|nr:hypothetical protein [Actinomycetes bacterium]